MIPFSSFLFVLGVLVFVHELGHFLVARWHGVRVITFSLGFGPKILKFTRGGTEYCISIMPLGGYVKLAGETAEEARTGAPDEFLSKSKWVRFQVYLAGPVMNIMLAIVVLAGVLSRGADVPLYESVRPRSSGASSRAARLRPAGCKVGDRIVSVEWRGRARPGMTSTWPCCRRPAANSPIGVVRDGQRLRSARHAERDRQVRDRRPRHRARLRDRRSSQVKPGMPGRKGGASARRRHRRASTASAASIETQIIERISHSAGKPLVLRSSARAQLREVTVMPEGPKARAVSACRSVRSRPAASIPRCRRPSR